MEKNSEDISYKKSARLSDEEVEALWSEHFSNSEDKVPRDKLIMHYIYLVRYVISRIKVSLPPTFTYEDVTSYGVEGLIDAIEKYTPNRGAHFETYALTRIRGTIIDKIRSQDWLPRTIRKKIKEIKDIAELMKQKLGRAPTTSEIAEKMGVEKERIDEILAQDSKVGSIYDKKSEDGSVEIIDTIEDEKFVQPDVVMEKNDSKKELELAMKKLPERERTLLVCYYHENMTLKQIGDVINISESRVCQLHAQAIMKLRNILSQKRSERLSKSII